MRLATSSTGSSGLRRGMSTLIAAAALVALIALAGCGSSDSSSSTSVADTGASTVAETDEGGGGSVPAPPEEPPKGIGVSTPLKKTPPAGKTIGALVCELPACQGYVKPYEEAAEKLGWKVETFVYKSGEPGPAMQEAINQKVDYIAITGQPPALFEQQLKEAKAANIPVISGDDVTPPDPSTGLYTQFGDAQMFEGQSEKAGLWILNDAGDEGANVAYVTIESYPILEVGYPALETTLNKYCDSCSVVKLPLTVEDLGEGKGPAKVIAFLQSHPEVNYLDFSFVDLMTGVPEAMKAAGMNDITITGQAMSESDYIIEEIEKGTIPAWIAQAIDYQSWLMVDAMARLAVGMPLSEERQAANMPTWVATKATLKYLQPHSRWSGPEGFEEEFEQLWGV
jgi:ABC-type sugar transport system substrate-binding protein